LRELGAFQPGKRVQRNDTDDQGTVIGLSGKLKVKWDNGSTSYFDAGKRANVRRVRRPSSQQLFPNHEPAGALDKR
jgi:hypothetical protein